MKALFSFLSCLIMLALFTRCADDELDGPSDGLPEKGLVVRLSTGKLDTKTQLTSTGNYHHVQEVWAVLYRLKDNATEESDANYEYITSEKLDWNPYKDTNEEEAGGAYGNGLVQGKEFLLHNNGTALSAGKYKVLCIGLDDVSGTVYNLKTKTTDGLNSGIFATGKTLDDAYAQITDASQGMEGELFAGWAEFRFEPDNLNVVEVEMKRRVAGILCYVTDIPRKITDNGEKEVKGIRLTLNRQANDKIHLCRKENPKDSDFGTSDNNTFTDPTILASYDLSPYTGGEGDIFTEPLQDWGEEVKIKDGSILFGAYLLPIEKTEGTASLSVELLGGENYSYSEGVMEGEVLATFNATRSAAGVETGGTDAFDVQCYDILPNYIYHIGNKPEPDGTDKDEPVSLLGNKLEVEVEEWTSQDIPVEFPGVPIMVTMEVPFLDSYIFDCVNTEFEIKVNPSVLKDEWRITVIDDSNYGDGIYIRSRDMGPDGKYTYSKSYDANEKEANEGAEITILLTDFVNRNTGKCWTDPENDYRTMSIVLENTETEAEKMTVFVKQYNAVMVTVGEETRGFARFDFETYRNRDGSIATLAESIIDSYGRNDGAGLYHGWGYWSAAATNAIIYGAARESDDDGKDNYINAKKAHISGYEGSAIQFSYKDILSVDGTTIGPTGEFWYLPASDELKSFLTKALQYSFNVKIYSANNALYNNNRYWTSEGGPSARSEACYIEGNEVKQSRLGRTTWFFIRQCCHVP